MVNKICELCGSAHKVDMRFGVYMCQDCIDLYNKAMQGDKAALTRLSNPANYPNATLSAQNRIIAIVARRAQKFESGDPVSPIAPVAPVAPPSKSAVTLNMADAKDKADGFLDGLYENIGQKIKNWAKWIFIVEAIAAIIGSFVMLFTDDLFAVGLLGIVIGPFIAWVSSWLLYGFGEIVEKSADNEKNTREILRILSSKKDDE